MNGMTAEQTIEYLKAYVERAPKRTETDLELDELEDICDAYVKTTYKAYFNARNPAYASLLCSDNTKEGCIRNIKAAETLDELHEHLFSPKALVNTKQRIGYNPNQLHEIVGHVIEVVKKCIDRKFPVAETVVSTKRQLQPFDVVRTGQEVVPETQDADGAEPFAPESGKKARKSGSKSPLDKYKERLSRQETVEDLTTFMKKTLKDIMKQSDIQPSLGLVEDYVLPYVRRREHIRHLTSEPDTLGDMPERQWINVRDSVQLLAIDATYEEIDGAWDYDHRTQNGTLCLSAADTLLITDALKSKFRNLIGQMRLAGDDKTVQYVQKNSKTVHVDNETEQDVGDDQDEERPEIESSKKGGGKLTDPFDMRDCPWIVENKLTREEIKNVEDYYLKKLEKAKTLDNVQRVWNNFFERVNHAKTQLTGSRFARVFNRIIDAAREISNKKNAMSSDLPVRKSTSYFFRLNNAVCGGQDIQELLTILFDVDKYTAHTMHKLDQDIFAKTMETGFHLLRATYMQNSPTSDVKELLREHMIPKFHGALESFWMTYFKFEISCYTSLDNLKEFIESFQSLMLSPEISIPNQVSTFALFQYLQKGLLMRQKGALTSGEISRAMVIGDSQIREMVENLTLLGEDFSISRMHETLFSHNLKEISDKHVKKTWRAIKILTADSVAEITEKIRTMFDAKKIKAIPVGEGAALSSAKTVKMSGGILKIGDTPIGGGAVGADEESDPAQDFEAVAKKNVDMRKQDDERKKAASTASAKKRKANEITTESEQIKKIKEISDTAKKTDLSTLESAKYGDYPKEGDAKLPPEFWKRFGAGVMMIRGFRKDKK